MKFIEWFHFFNDYAARSNKYFFSVTELANATGIPGKNLNTELYRLRKQGLVTRYWQGVYGLSGRIVPEHLLKVMDPGAYITGSYALYEHRLITQVPVILTCFTNRRHGRLRQTRTPAGAFIFIMVKKGIYAYPQTGILAPPEQALCDFFYHTRKAGVRPESQVTFIGLDKINISKITGILMNYPQSVKKGVIRCLGSNSCPAY
jgi:predicted transcriptional regulator of viral defense system